MSYETWAFLPYCSHHSILRGYCEMYAASQTKLRQRNQPISQTTHIFIAWDNYITGLNLHYNLGKCPHQMRSKPYIFNVAARPLDFFSSLSI